MREDEPDLDVEGPGLEMMDYGGRGDAGAAIVSCVL